MRGFIFHTLLYAVSILLPLYGIVLMANGSTDPFYLRTTTPRQAGLIVGSSRPAQAFIPSQMNGPLSPTYNFSFTGVHSPYGPIYLEAIRNKMDPAAHGAHHVVAVDPWGISADRSAPNDPYLYKERDLLLGTTPTLDSDPNIQYFLHAYKDRLMDIIVKRFQPDQMFLHDDGWLQVTINRSAEQQAKRVRNLLNEHRKEAGEVVYSPLRHEYLRRTIALLSTTGDVRVVRLPISRQLLAIEDSLMPDFNERMQRLADQLEVPYIDFTDSVDGFSYTDGSHVDQTTARRISKLIATGQPDPKP